MNHVEFIKTHSDAVVSAITGAIASVTWSHHNFDVTDWIINSSYALLTTFIVAMVGGIGGWIGKQLIEWLWTQSKRLFK